MPTSKKKILANRRNSKKSTGPVSNEGKLKSSLNSIKHGLYGDKIAVIGENVDDINDIIDRLSKELKPIGIQQELIVSKMIDIAIRFKRIPFIEAGILNHEMQEYEASGKKEVGETKPNLDLKYKIKLKKIKKEKIKSDHEKEIDNYIKKRNLERAEELKKIREEHNKPKITFIEPIRKDPSRGMRFITNFEPINRGRLGHSKAFLKDVQKPKTYYW